MRLHSSHHHRRSHHTAWHSWVHSWHSWHSWWSHHLLLLHLHLSLSHHRSLLLLSLHHHCLLLRHWVWSNHSWHHRRSGRWMHWCWHSWGHHLLRHSRFHHWLLHWHTSSRSHSVGHLLLLNHHHVLVSLHHHLLLLLDCHHVSHVMTTSHHLLLSLHHHMLSWVEVSGIGSLSRLVGCSVLLHLLESSLLRNHTLLGTKLGNSSLISIFLSFFYLVFQETELALFDSKWVLFIIVCREGQANLVIALISKFWLSVSTSIKASLEWSKWSNKADNS